MATVASVAAFLEQFAPPDLAESWDNVGLLVGDPNAEVRKVMTCLTITPASAAEAIESEADLIVAHHPLPFRPLPRITTCTVAGRLLLDLIAAKVAVYSPHTAFDSAHDGINQRLAEGLGLADIGPLVPSAAAGEAELGGGRFGRLTAPLGLVEMVERVKMFLGVERLHVVGSDDGKLTSVAVACGSGGDFIEAACDRDCDCLVTGEARFHACLEAEARGVALILAGHFASERFAVEDLAERLAARLPDATVWASCRESDPLRWR